MEAKEEQKLKVRGIRPTSMRILVLRYLLEENNCTSLADLELRFYNADKSTLFRTLKVFEENGLIHQIDDGTGSMKYGLCMDDCDCSVEFQHYHFHCTNCRGTYCLDFTSVPKTELPAGFKVESANIVLKGLCALCN